MGRSGLATNSYLATPADLMLTQNEGEPRYAETEVRPVTCFLLSTSDQKQDIWP